MEADTLDDCVVYHLSEETVCTAAVLILPPSSLTYGTSVSHSSVNPVDFAGGDTLRRTDTSPAETVPPKVWSALGADPSLSKGDKPQDAQRVATYSAHSQQQLRGCDHRRCKIVAAHVR